MVPILRLAGTAEYALSDLGVVDVRFSYTPPGGDAPCTGTLAYFWLRRYTSPVGLTETRDTSIDSSNFCDLCEFPVCDLEHNH